MATNQPVELGIRGVEDAVEIGRGGFAVVYRAFQPAFERFVAVKVLDISAVDAAAQGSFQRECRAIGKLSGRPNILTVHEAGLTETGRPYLVMALAKESLEDSLDRRGSIPVPEVVEIGLKVGGALEFAHRAGILHRDVKPANILISEDGEPQLADFGIARVASATLLSGSGLAFTPTHAPPEAVEGKPPTAAADVYSLASTLFNLIAGHAAFVEDPDDSLFVVLARVGTAPVPDLRPRGVPDPLCRVIENGMAKDPGERPPSAAAFTAALEAARQPAGVGAGLGAGDDSPPTSQSAGAATTVAADVPSNLPGDVTSLVGRQTEIEQVHRDLDAARVVTLTGPGGSGKTRLAIAAARELRDQFPHGVWFVDLSTVEDVALVEPAIGAVVDVRESPERTVAETLRDHLRDRKMLLLLDNLEQLLPAVADLVAGLVRSAPHVRVLVTSRELLRIAGERSHPVPPLDLDEGVALFVDRARAHRADLALTEESLAAVRAIAERLDGLPLALELAAARVRMLTPRMILERLGRSLDLGGGARDLPERQRTLRGAVAWSYELLPEPERRLFARLGVFAGGWTFDSALVVADPDSDLGIDLMEGIESLADKSLVRIEPPVDGGPAAEDGPRFGMHPLLREFALERLDESGERPTVEERLAAECASIAERTGELILQASGEAAMAVLDREERNVHAALDWSLAHDDPRYGLRIIGASWRWFQGRGRLREARGTLTRLLERPSPVDSRVRIAALAAAGGLAYWMRDFVAAQAAYEERLALAEETGDPIHSADAHYDLGFIGMVSQDDAMLRAHEERALELYTAAGHEDGAILAREALVLSLFLGGEYTRARELETLNLDLFRRAGSPMQIASASTLLSAIEWRGGDVEQGWERLIGALSLFHSLEHPPGLVRVLGLASIMLLAGGPSEVGARAAGATYRLVRERGLMLGPVHVLHLPEPSTLAEAQFGLERAAELMAEGEAMTPDDVVAAIAGSPAPRAPAP